MQFTACQSYAVLDRSNCIVVLRPTDVWSASSNRSGASMCLSVYLQDPGVVVCRELFGSGFFKISESKDGECFLDMSE